MELYMCEQFQSCSSQQGLLVELPMTACEVPAHHTDEAVRRQSANDGSHASYSCHTVRKMQ